MRVLLLSVHVLDCARALTTTDGASNPSPDLAAAALGASATTADCGIAVPMSAALPPPRPEVFAATPQQGASAATISAGEISLAGLREHGARGRRGGRDVGVLPMRKPVCPTRHVM